MLKKSLKIDEPVKESVITPAVEKPVLTEKPKEVFAKSGGTTCNGSSKVETLETMETKKEVAEKIALEPIKDLRGAIGINDKFQFMEELFNKDESLFESSIKTINNYQEFCRSSILDQAKFKKQISIGRKTQKQSYLLLINWLKDVFLEELDNVALVAPAFSFT